MKEARIDCMTYNKRLREATVPHYRFRRTNHSTGSNLCFTKASKKKSQQHIRPEVEQLNEEDLRINRKRLKKPEEVAPCSRKWHLHPLMA